MATKRVLTSEERKLVVKALSTEHAVCVRAAKAEFDEQIRDLRLAQAAKVLALGSVFQSSELDL